MAKKIWAWKENDYIAVSMKKPSKEKSEWGFYQADQEDTIPEFLEKLFKGVKKDPQRFEVEVRKI